MSSSTFKCPKCNAPIFYPGGSDVTIECMFCGHNVPVPPELRSAPGSATSSASPNAAPSLPGLGSLMKQISSVGEIAQLARNGDKAEAARRFQEAFNVGPAEAQAAVENMAAGQFTQANAGSMVTSSEGVDPDVSAQIKQWLAAGNKIEAIKVYRQFTGLGLKEAKEAVEALEAGQPMVINMNTAQTAQNPAALAAVQALVQAGNKLEAIKVYRQMTGLGLKEAKDAVEALETGQPAIIMTTSVGMAQGSAAQNPAALAAVQSLVQAGKKIEAIKVYRQMTGLGLKEAKDAVEALEAGGAGASTFQIGSSNAYTFQQAGQPAVTPTPAGQRSGLNCMVIGLIVGVIFFGMIALAVALLVFNFAR